MNTGRPAFAFTPHEAALLMKEIGQTDISAISFITDVEACLQAFEYATNGEMSSGMPKEISDRLATIAHTAAELRSALYQLPEDVGMLLDLHLLSDGARRRIGMDFSQIVEPLEDMAGGIVELRRTAGDDGRQKNLRLEEHLVRAIATAFRNRMNRKPDADTRSGFPGALTHILEAAGHRLPGVAAAAAAITPARLRTLLKSGTDGSAPITR